MLLESRLAPGTALIPDLTGLDNELINVWLNHDCCLKGQDNADWLDMTGGIALPNIQTEFELIVAAHTAPNRLFFGLAYGKWSDALANPEHHALEMTWGQTSPIHRQIGGWVIRRGHALERLTEFNHPEFIERLTARGSCDSIESLREQALLSPNKFHLGQITSWLLTAHQIAQRDTDSLAARKTVCAMQAA